MSWDQINSNYNVLNYNKANQLLKEKVLENLLHPDNDLNKAIDYAYKWCKQTGYSDVTDPDNFSEKAVVNALVEILISKGKAKYLSKIYKDLIPSNKAEHLEIQKKICKYFTTVNDWALANFAIDTMGRSSLAFNELLPEIIKRSINNRTFHERSGWNGGYGQSIGIDKIYSKLSSAKKIMFIEEMFKQQTGKLAAFILKKDYNPYTARSIIRTFSAYNTKAEKLACIDFLVDALNNNAFYTRYSDNGSVSRMISDDQRVTTHYSHENQFKDEGRAVGMLFALAADADVKEKAIDELFKLTNNTLGLKLGLRLKTLILLQHYDKDRALKQLKHIYFEKLDSNGRKIVTDHLRQNFPNRTAFDSYLSIILKEIEWSKDGLLSHPEVHEQRAFYCLDKIISDILASDELLNEGVRVLGKNNIYDFGTKLYEKHNNDHQNLGMEFLKRSFYKNYDARICSFLYGKGKKTIALEMIEALFRKSGHLSDKESMCIYLYAHEKSLSLEYFEKLFRESTNWGQQRRLYKKLYSFGEKDLAISMAKRLFDSRSSLVSDYWHKTRAEEIADDLWSYGEKTHVLELYGELFDRIAALGGKEGLCKRLLAKDESLIKAKAVELFEKLFDLTSDWEQKERICNTLYSLNEKGKAIELFEKLFELTPNWEQKYRICNKFYEIGEKDKGLELFKKLFDITANWNNKEKICERLYKLKERDTALIFFKQLFQMSDVTNFQKERILRSLFNKGEKDLLCDLYLHNIEPLLVKDKGFLGKFLMMLVESEYYEINRDADKFEEYIKSIDIGFGEKIVGARDKDTDDVIIKKALALALVCKDMQSKISYSSLPEDDPQIIEMKKKIRKVKEVLRERIGRTIFMSKIEGEERVRNFAAFALWLIMTENEKIKNGEKIAERISSESIQELIKSEMEAAVEEQDLPRNFFKSDASSVNDPRPF